MDDSPAALFDSYEQDFKHILQGVGEKLNGAGGEGKGLGEQQKTTLRRVEMELDEADEMVAQMEIEIQGIPQSIKQQYQNRLKSCKADLSRYKKLSKDMHTKASRADLFTMSGTAGDYGSPSDDPYSDRSRLLAGTEVLADGSRRLADSQRIALETEDHGAEILRSLRGQREQIENARDTLHTADTSINRASSTLKKMIIQMYRQRFVMIIGIVILIALIAIILWAKFRR